MNKSILPRGFGVLLVAGFLSAGCGETSLPPAPGPPVVTVAVPVEQTVTDKVDFSGKTAAVESVELRARVDGYLQTVQYEEGNEVKKDQVLFGIDPRPYQIELERANAQVKAAEAQAAQADATYRRSASLMRSNATSVEQLEKDRRTRDVSVAALAATKANVQLKQINRDFTNVISPINGRVDKADVTVGNLVSANLNDANVLTNIVRMEPMYAYFDVDELTALRLLRLQLQGKLAPREQKPPEVLLGLGRDSNYPLRGTVDFVGNQIDPSTGTITARGVFPNKDRALSPGLFVHIRLPLGEPHKALLVNDRALGTNQGQKFLYIVNEKNKIEYRPVTIRALHNGLREVTDGLKPGERVVINGLVRVRPGVTVEPKSGEMRPESTDKR
jgi:RND family efflux transporter MFP subunit